MKLNYFSALPLSALLLVCNFGHAAEPEGYATLNGGTTGGAGGIVAYANTGTDIQQALCDRASSDIPITIYVEGTINHANTNSVEGNCYSSDSLIAVRNVSNVSIIGTGDGAVFDQIGINVRESQNIIFQNLNIRNVKKSQGVTSNGGDAISLTYNVSNVWIDHCTLEASGGEVEGFDSLVDMKVNTKYVTLSYNIFRNSGRASLIGSSTADTENSFITFHSNWFDNIDSRTPLIRYGKLHAYNNFYSNINLNGINARLGAEVKLQSNHFRNTYDVIGSYYSNELGFWDIGGNKFSGIIHWQPDADMYHPAGPDPVSTAQIPADYSYSLDSGSDVPTIARATAGANSGLHYSSHINCSKYMSIPILAAGCNSVPAGEAQTSCTPIAPPPNWQCLSKVSVTTDDWGFCSLDGKIESEHEGFFGSGYVNTTNESGSAIEWSIVAPKTGFYTAELHYANGSTEDRDGNYLVNNNAFFVDLPFTGAWASYNYSAEIRIYLTEGENWVRLEAVTEEGLPNISQLTVYGASTASGSCIDDDIAGTNIQINEKEPGFCGLDGSIESEHEGFMGEGYANTKNEKGSTVAWAINASKSGFYTVLTRYANASTEDRDGEYVINGTRTYVDFPTTEGWNNYKNSQYLSLQLEAGENILELEAVTDEGLPNIDVITVFGKSAKPGSCL